MMIGEALGQAAALLAVAAWAVVGSGGSRTHAALAALRWGAVAGLAVVVGGAVAPDEPARRLVVVLTVGTAGGFAARQAEVWLAARLARRRRLPPALGRDLALLATSAVAATLAVAARPDHAAPEGLLGTAPDEGSVLVAVTVAAVAVVLAVVVADGPWHGAAAGAALALVLAGAAGLLTSSSVEAAPRGLELGLAGMGAAAVAVALRPRGPVPVAVATAAVTGVAASLAVGLPFAVAAVLLLTTGWQR